MQVTKPKSVIWDSHPSPSNLFCVSSQSELRLYSFSNPTKSTPNPYQKTLSVLTSLPSALRSLSWSPTPLIPDLFALGLSSGKTLLLRLDATTSSSAIAQAENGNQQPKIDSFQISIKNPRGVNVVNFDRDGGKIVIGFEKVNRSDGLLVFDTEVSFQANVGTTPTPLHQYAPSESISSSCFLSPFLLAAGVSSKFLRIYDFRSPSTTSPSITFLTRSLSDLKPNPFEENQLISFGADDGIIRLWDIRRSGGECLMSWSENDSGSTSENNRSRKGLLEVNWNPCKRGVVGALEKESMGVRIWNILEGSWYPPLATGNSNGGEANDREEGNNNNSINPLERLPPIFMTTSNSATQGNPTGTVNNVEPVEQSIRTPILWNDSKSKSFHFGLSSFTFVNSSTGAGSEIIGVAKDSSKTGHRLEVVEIGAAGGGGSRMSSLSEKKLVIAFNGGRKVKNLTLVDSLDEFGTSGGGIEEDPADEEDDQSDENEDETSDGDDDGLTPISEFPPTGTTTKSGLPRGRSRNLVLSLGTVDRNETPRPGATGAGDGNSNELVLPGGLQILKKDMTIVIRNRVEKGYGGNPHLNATLVDSSSLSEFWKWIARAESLSMHHSHSHEHDFRFRGVLSLLLSFPPSSSSTQSSSSSSTNSRPKHTSQSNQHTIYSEFSKSLKRGDDAQAYIVAVNGMVVKKKLNDVALFGGGGGGALAGQRRLALEVCGEEWILGWEEVCERLNKSGNHEGAARHAFFSGHLERAMSYLKICESVKLRLMAPVLAAYLSQKDSAKGSDSVYAELCRSLSSDVETPWIRAMFAFLASSDWRELVDETGLLLRDRVAVALRFLSDSELVAFLQGLATEAIASGDLEAVVLLGLRGDGLKLISNFVDRTADVQTAALAVSFVSPGLDPSSRLADRWIQTYRQTLNQLQLYAPRALFDGAQGRRARAAMEQARMAGRSAELGLVKAALKKMAPVQMMVRCQFCAKNISGRDDEIGGAHLGVRADICPKCSKTLPGCSICLKVPSVHNIASDGTSSLCWCQRCRHGGHVTHILEWFEKSDVCAVASCDCRCRDG